jgi:hypothetical protein
MPFKIIWQRTGICWVSAANDDENLKTLYFSVKITGRIHPEPKLTFYEHQY